jgi:glycosyltransferase involved in cell wall biosynthesis
MEQPQKTLLILGTRGVPANHGGFETFAERYALFLAARGWSVSVYCQEDVDEVTQPPRTDVWRGVTRIFIETARKGGAGTLDFDWKCVRDALTRPGVCLVLGYNGAAFLPVLRLAGRKVFTNMDGIEWKRPKWPLPVRAWFYVNEWIAAWTSQRLVADHPAIAAHLATRRSRKATVVIPYGGDPVETAPDAPLAALGLEPGGYLVSIARIEPDNNILTIVKAFSAARRGFKLVVLGRFEVGNSYHAEVRAAASDEVVFPGAIYDPTILRSLRFHARAYLHGHTVGGTNPSLVEALWAGNAVIAHDNAYNRWTAGAAAIHFSDVASCAAAISLALADDALVERLGEAARARAASAFKWRDVLMAYERECLALAAPRGTRPQEALQPTTPRWV